MSKPDNEAKMVIAHQLGSADASSHFAVICMRAMNVFDTHEEQFAYISGYIMELTRIARKQDREHEAAHKDDKK